MTCFPRFVLFQLSVCFLICLPRLLLFVFLSVMVNSLDVLHFGKSGS